MCGGEQNLGAGKCAAWNCRDRNRVGGGGGTFGGGCAFGHESRNAYSGRGCKHEYGYISSFGGVVDRMENWTVCSVQCRSGGAGYKYNLGCVIKFRSWHWSASPFWCGHGYGNGIGGECRCGDGDKHFGGSRRLEGGLRMGANLKMEGHKFLLYLLDVILQRQLKGRYWRCRWCANQEGVGWSRWLTLIIKCSDELFHGVNEDGEFGGFCFSGGSKGQCEQEWTIERGCRSCGAVKDKVCGVVDLF